MLLRKLMLILCSMICISTLSLAQNVMYVEYSNDCMTRLEYKTTSQTYNGKTIHYYASSIPSTKLILEMRKGEGKRLASKPSYVVPCNRVQYNETLMRKCNTGETDVYVVSRDKNGYSAHYVESIALLKNAGNKVSYNSFTYGFEYALNNVSPSANLAFNSNYNDVMYRGMTGLNCKDVYTLRKSTKNTCGAHTDIAFSPEIGILRSSEIQNEQFADSDNQVISTNDLMYINHLPVDNYVGGLCQGNKPKDPTLYVAPPVAVPDEFSSRGETITTAPVIAPAPKPSPVIKPNPVIKPVPVVKPATNDFTNGIAANTEHGEPTAPVTNYVSECNTYKKAGYHIVRPKENLYSISRMTGITVANLAEWNEVSNQELIPACSELRLIPPTPDMYAALEAKKIEVKNAAQKKALEEKAAKAKLAREKAMAEFKAKTLAKLKADKEKKEAEAKEKAIADGVAKALAAKEKTDELSIKGDELSIKGDVKNVNKKPTELASLENVHIVKDGETLYMIAKQYGFTSEKFMKINGLTSDIITPQMRLKTTDCACGIPDDYTPKGDIPQSYDATAKIIKDVSITHEIKAGDTLYNISKKHGVSVDRIMLLNAIKDPTDLSVGQEIKIK